MTPPYPSYLSLLLAIFFIGTGCQNGGKSDAVHMTGLATPITLELGTNTILLKDYFRIPEMIDSVSTSGGALLSMDEEELTLQIQGLENMQPMFNVRVHIGDKQFDIPAKSPNQRHISLMLDDSDYTDVRLKGEMNAWNVAEGILQRKGSKWAIEFDLPPGNYQYLFVIDGVEFKDPRNDREVPNGMGGFNSLLVIPKPELKSLPILRTRSTQDQSVTISSTLVPEEVFAYWENQRIPVDINTSEIHLSIPESAANMDRSYLRLWATNSKGISNDLFIPLEKGSVIMEANELDRNDLRTQIMYFALVDRFFNGDSTNDRPVADERLTEKTNFHGGDVQGITEMIRRDYFADLSMNSLWLSPITQNPLGAYQEYPEPRRWYSGYHGYWPIRSTTVDHRFGSKDALKEMVGTAHENDINVLLDYVCNHIHKEHQLYQDHPEWATQLDLPDGQKNIRIWEEHRLTTWFDSFLPTLDLSDPQVVEIQSDSALYWIEEYELDGFRHDATKHIPQIFWRTLTQKIRKKVIIEDNRPVFQIGETYGSRPLISSYIGSGLLDAQFDFNLHFDARSVIGNENIPFDLLKASLLESFEYYGHHHLMGNMSGNHDQPRFISLAGGSLKWDEDAREAGFQREIAVGDEKGYALLQMLHAFNYSIPGIPVMFYGDEIGMPGANDPDNRRPMRFTALSEKEQETLEVVTKLGVLRSSKMPLLYGDTEILMSSENNFALLRSYFGEHCLIVFNRSESPATLNITIPQYVGPGGWKSHFGHSYQINNKQALIQLPAYSFDFLTIQ